MTITPYSIVMSILWFSVACLIGCVLLPRISRGGMALVAAIFVLAFVRLCVPLDSFRSVVVRSYSAYSFLQKIVQKPILHSFTLGQIFLPLWAVGAVIRMAWLTRKLISQHRFRSSAYIPDYADDSMVLARQVSKDLGYSGEVHLGIVPNATTAYQAGFFHPYILLPGNIEDFSLADIRNMLYHELCHFLGFDLWILLTIQIVNCALWWNPVMYLLSRNVRHLLELHCDQRVCRHLGISEQYDYMQTLINLVRNNSASPFNVVVGYTGDSEANIIQRFQLLTQTKTTSTERVKLFTGLVICGLLLIASYCFVIQPGAIPPTTAIEGDDVETFLVSAFIMRSADGHLTLYLDGKAAYSLSEKDLQKEPYCNYIVFDVDKEEYQ